MFSLLFTGRIKILLLMLSVFIIQYASGCELKTRSNMVADNFGNTFLLIKKDRLSQVSVKPANSAVWTLSTILSPNEAFQTVIAPADHGAIVAWIEIIEYPSVCAIYVSMYSSGAWTVPFAVSDLAEKALHDMNIDVLYNPVSKNTEVNISWTSLVNGQLVTRTNAGVFGDNSSWSGPFSISS